MRLIISILFCIMFECLSLAHGKSDISTWRKVSLSPILDWTDVKGATSYKLIIKKLDVDGSILSKTTLTTSDSKYQPILENGASYQIIIKSKGKKSNKLHYYLKAAEKYIYISGNQFLPYGSSSNFLRTSQFLTSADGEWAFANLKFPDGIVVQSIQVYYQDNFTNENIYFYRRPFGVNAGTEVIATIITDGSGNAGSSTTTTFSNNLNIIDNENYSYYLWLAAAKFPCIISDILITYNGETIE